MQKLLLTLRENLGTEEVLFLLGNSLLYAGCAAQFGHPVALIVTGLVCVIVSLISLIKGA